VKETVADLASSPLPVWAVVAVSAAASPAACTPVLAPGMDSVTWVPDVRRPGAEAIRVTNQSNCRDV